MNSFVLGIAILIGLQILIPFTRHYSVTNDVTYTQDVQPIIKNRCSQCHNSSVPDRNWMDYNTAYKKRAMIKIRLKNKSMPPGNATGMTDEERLTMIKWVDEGGKK